MRALLALAIAIPAFGDSPATALAQDQFAAELALVHSELEYLDVKDRKITLDVDKASPEEVLGKIALKAGFRWSAHGTLPTAPKLTASFKEATVRETLEWLAEKTGVLYRVKGPLELEVYPSPEPGN